MKLRNTVLQPYRLLDNEGRRELVLLVVVFFLAGVASAAMVLSVFPFLTLLSNNNALAELPWLAAAYDRFNFTSPQNFMAVLGAGTVLITAVANVLILLQVYLLSGFVARQKLSLSRRLFDRYLTNSYAYFLSQHSGDLTARVISQADEVAQNGFRPVAHILSSGISVASVLIALVWLNPMIAFGALLALGGGYGIVLVASRKFVRRVGKTRAISNEERHRVVAESLGSIKAVKLYGLEEFSSNRFTVPSVQFANAEVSIQVVSEFPRAAIQTLALGCVIGLSLLIANSNTQDPASQSLMPLLGVLGLAGMRLQPEIQRLFSALTKLQYVAASFERLTSDLGDEATASVTPSLPAIKRLRLHDKIELRAVSYRYPGDQKAVIDELNLTVHKGQRIGIVGVTGAGKSTLADLLLGLLMPEDGLILVDGIPLNRDNVKSWRYSVGYVPQEITLRDAEIAENIAYGVMPGDIDHERVRQVARVASIADFIENELPEGYRTIVGERGIRLSGGQRQRVAIARALYRDVDMIVFDEATSALDYMTESEIMAAIDGLPGDKTIIMIAHRLSTVRGCDYINLIENGKITSSGNWENLVRESVVFRDLVNTDLRGGGRH